MDKTHNKRHSMLNERLMESWGYKKTKEEEEVLEEGILDRTIGNVKSFASGITDPLSRGYKALKGQAVDQAEDPETRKQRSKFNSLLNGKLKKIKKLKDDLENDIHVMKIDPKSQAASTVTDMLDITVSVLQGVLDGKSEIFDPFEQDVRAQEEEEDDHDIPDSGAALEPDEIIDVDYTEDGTGW